MIAGEFSGEPQARWLTEPDVPDRNMRTTEDFWYRDWDGLVWPAPAGTVTDGASIPKPLWSSVGSPFTGDYRRAAIAHDVACVAAGVDSDKRRAADRMFYQACRTGGCSIAEATILYVGVRIGAQLPVVAAWSLSLDDVGPRIEPAPVHRRIEADFQLAAHEVADQGETDDVMEIERRTDAALSRVTGMDLGVG